MCFLALFYRTAAAAPVMLASNREEYFGRPFTAPAVQSGPLAVFCGIDQQGGGTWLGVNQRGLLIAVTNRPKAVLPARPISRGVLARELLRAPTAHAAAEQAQRELATGRYAGVNLLCVDRQWGGVVEHHEQTTCQELSPGLHLLSNGRMNDGEDMRQAFARGWLAPRFPYGPAEFVPVARELLSIGPDRYPGKTILVRNAERGTVSSAIVVLSADVEQAQYWYAPGPPDTCPYDDLSAELRSVLRRG